MRRAALRLVARRGARDSVLSPLHSVGRTTISVTVDVRARDAFRLVVWEARAVNPQRLKAYPRPLSLQRVLAPLQTQAFAGSEVARSKGEGVEYADIRDFVPGDRVRSINWRASARRQGLVVNERHPERNTDVVLFVDSFTDVRADGRSTSRRPFARPPRSRRGTSSAGTGSGSSASAASCAGCGRASGTTQRYRLIETLLETGVEPTYTWRDVSLIPAKVLPPPPWCSR